jgi:hypothetical protein
MQNYLFRTGWTAHYPGALLRENSGVTFPLPITGTSKVRYKK